MPQLGFIKLEPEHLKRIAAIGEKFLWELLQECNPPDAMLVLAMMNEGLKEAHGISNPPGFVPAMRLEQTLSEYLKVLRYEGRETQAMKLQAIIDGAHLLEGQQ